MNFDYLNVLPMFGSLKDYLVLLDLSLCCSYLNIYLQMVTMFLPSFLHNFNTTLNHDHIIILI